VSDIYKKQTEILRSVQPVVTAFHKYVETSGRSPDKSLITGFTREELEGTLNVFSSSRGDKESGWYIAISRRLDEIDREEQNRKKSRDKWKDRFIGAAITLLVWAITEYIRRAWK
jgi:hypothetical protein